MPRGPLGCVLALALAAAAALVAYGFGAHYLPVAPFDPAAWKEGDRLADPVRLRMIEPLVRGGRLDGLTRAQVLQLLGPPGDHGYFSDWSLVYWLGPERGLMGIDSEWLAIRIGEDGRVSEYRILRD